MAKAARLKALVVGGGAGGNLSMTALVKSPLFELVGAADLNPEVCAKLEADYPGIKTFTDYKRMFAEMKADVVCVSTFPPSHEQVTLDALATQPLKGILVEKPLGHTVASGRRILEAVKAKGIPMAVPHGMLQQKSSVEIIERVRRGEIGRLKLVEVQCAKWDIINAGIHWMNFFVNLTGLEPLDYVMAICEASTRTYRDGMQVETTGVTYAQTKSGVRLVMNTGDEVICDPEIKGTPFRIVGTDGVITFGGWADNYRILNKANPEGSVVKPGSYEESGHRRHLEAMAAMIDGSKPLDYSVAESSLMALELVEGAYLSSARRCKVLFPVDSFTPPAPVEWEPGKPYSGKGGGRDGRKL